MFMQLNELTIKQAGKTLEKGEITSVELTRACLARIKEINGKLNACLTVCEKEALEEARMADKRKKMTVAREGRGRALPLLGIPYLAKDNILTRGVRATAASKILENYIAPYDATVISKLRQAGAVLLGKTNLDEFGHGASTENSVFGPTRNPHDLERVAGGSSGGSAAAVAADMCVFALGTDTGGSTRYPAGFCGVVGLKPTYGRASRFGLMAMTSSTDVPGVIAKNVQDAEIVLKTIEGVDKYDATTTVIPAEAGIQNLSSISPSWIPGSPARLASPDFNGQTDFIAHDFTNGLKVINEQGEAGGSPRMTNSLKGVKIGLPKEYFVEGIMPEVKEAIEKVIAKFKELGAEFIEVNLPHTKYGIPVYYIITPSEISSNLARFDGIKYGYSEIEKDKDRAHTLMKIYTKSRGVGFGSEAKRRIMLGTYALSAGYYDAYYLRAQRVRTIIKREMDEVLEKVDCLLTPTSPHVAFKIGTQNNDPLKNYLEDIFMSPASLAGLPAMSVPCGFAKSHKSDKHLKHLPIGMQLIGKRFGEEILFKAGQAYEEATELHKRKPGI